jgi:hypothetical protein
MANNLKSLVEQYVYASWILKIRLLSARRQLWDQQTSLIHIENSVLQVRKICESVGYMYMCVVAAEIDAFEVSSRLRKEYDVGKIFKRLPEEGAHHFPRKSQLILKEAREKNSEWELREYAFEPSERDRVTQIFNKSGNVLHEAFLYKNFRSLSKESLSADLNMLRYDHQWLWNRFWQTSNRLHGSLFFVDLGEDNTASRPRIVRNHSLMEEDIHLEFDPDIIADFTGTIDWSRLNS